MAYNEEKLTKLKSLKALAERVKQDYATKASVSALETRVDGLVTTGGEPNKIEAVKVNGEALPVTDKAVEVGAAIQAAIAATGHASFEKADAVPEAADARENVLYLVMNAKTKHYDIYAKVGDEVVLLDDTTVDLSGYVEKAEGKGLSSNDFTDEEKAKLGDFYNGKKNGFDWCDVLMDWLFVTTFGRELGQKLLCQPNKSLGAGTKYSMDYYKARGRFFLTPQPGDQIFFGTATVTSHTGIVTDVKDGYVYTVEGNAGSPSAVRACKYSLRYAKIKGYGRLDWPLVPAEQEDDDMKYYARCNAGYGLWQLAFGSTGEADMPTSTSGAAADKK